MNIKEIQAFATNLNRHLKTTPRVARKADTVRWLSPMRLYPNVPRAAWNDIKGWPQTACIVTAEDGAWGFGLTREADPS